MKTAICTILAKNYVSFSRTLFASFQALHPGVPCYALIVDEWRGFLRQADEPFAIVSLDELGIPDLKATTFKYDITELSTAAKPFLLDHLLRTQGIDKLLYLDPDILVTGDLSALFSALDSADFIVTPHVDTDYPDDGHEPNDKFILLSGIYNLGFFGIRKSDNAFAFLDWWKHKLTTKCVIDHAIGYFVDQRFIDLAFGLFSGFTIIRDTGYNTAYWNVHSRAISRENQIWRSNNRPLYFFHFSGYNPLRPRKISKYLTRYTFEARPDLQPIFAEYTAKVLAHNFDETSKWPYTFGKYENGESIPYLDRQYYREIQEKGAQPPLPFTSPVELRRMAKRLRTSHPLSFRSATLIYLGALRQILFPPKKHPSSEPAVDESR
ncbi:MAG: hypothetical protein ABIO94_00630 [Opitutaceae bacterium]